MHQALLVVLLHLGQWEESFAYSLIALNFMTSQRRTLALEFIRLFVREDVSTAGQGHRSRLAYDCRQRVPLHGVL